MIGTEIAKAVIDAQTSFWAPSFLSDEAESWAQRKISLPCSDFLTTSESTIVERVAELAPGTWLYGSTLWRPVFDRLGYNDVVRVVGADVDVAVSGLPNIFALWELREGTSLRVFTIRPNKVLLLSSDSRDCRPLDITLFECGPGDWPSGESPNYLRSLAAKIDSGSAQVIIPQKVCRPQDFFKVPYPEIAFSPTRLFTPTVRTALKVIGDACRCGFNPPTEGLSFISSHVRPRVKEVIENGERLDFNTLYALYALFAFIRLESNQRLFVEAVNRRLGINRELVKLSFQLHEVFFEEIWGKGMVVLDEFGVQGGGVWINRFSKQDMEDCLACF